MRIDVHVWPLSPDLPIRDDDLALLADAERVRMARFVFAKDRARFSQAHARMRRLIGAHIGAAPAELAFGESEHGKPFLSRGPFFNLSHSHNLAALAICDDLDLGVDIERVRAIEGADIARRFFSNQECAALSAYQGGDYERAFYRCWTRKEAYVKAQGEGLSISLQAFEVTVEENAPRFLRIDGDDAGAWRLFSFKPADGYQGAVAIRSSRDDISLNVMTSE